MKSTIPKQFMLINEIPVLYHCLNIFQHTIPEIHIIVSLPENYQEYWLNLIKNLPPIQHQCVNGGIHRFESVKNALKYVPNSALVAIHDGVRPLVHSDTILKAFELAEKYDSAIPVCQLNYSLRQFTENGNSNAVDRNFYVRVNTPQCFKAALLKAAYNCNFQQNFTDDASVFEAFGHHIHLFEDFPQNIKITYPEDLMTAEAILQQQNKI